MPKMCTKCQFSRGFDTNLMRILHLFYKEPVLYNGIKNFLHLYLRGLAKTHAEGVVESMGNYIEMHS